LRRKPSPSEILLYTALAAACLIAAGHGLYVLWQLILFLGG
jgi:hypothetical protein